MNLYEIHEYTVDADKIELLANTLDESVSGSLEMYPFASGRNCFGKVGTFDDEVRFVWRDVHGFVRWFQIGSFDSLADETDPEVRRKLSQAALLWCAVEQCLPSDLELSRCCGKLPVGD